MSEHTNGKWEVIARKDDSCDQPFFEYHIISHPYGQQAGPQRICEVGSKFDSHHICLCVNSYDSLIKQRDDLLTACEEAYEEGYANGYADGINADESCVPETTYFKNDFMKAWNQSDTKAAIVKHQESSTSVAPKKSGINR